MVVGNAKRPKQVSNRINGKVKVALLDLGQALIEAARND